MEKRKWTNIKAVEAEIIKMCKDALGLKKVQIKNWIS